MARARAKAAARGRVVLGARRLTLADVAAVADGARASLAPAARRRLVRARRVVERLARGETPIYGLTTGLGAAVDTKLAASDRAAFQTRAILARAVAVDTGDALSNREVRAILFARLAGLARGRSGISPRLARALADWLDRGFAPRTHATGSIGLADLAILAGLFLPLVGAGRAWRRGREIPGAEALAALGLSPQRLGAKDGIALLNANAATVGRGALVLAAAFEALDALTAAAALSYEGFGANLRVLDPRLHALRPAPGQAEEAARLRALLRGSALRRPGRARRVQDPVSFRSVAPIHGAARDALSRAAALIELELNAASDSPAVLFETGEIHSTVNFDTTALVLALEAAGQALAHCAAAAHFRVQKLMSPGFSGLPRFLAPEGGRRNGFATLQKTTAALEAEIRHQAQPASLLAAPVADGVEDYATMAPYVVAKLGRVARALARVAAAELVVAAEAAELAGAVPGLGRGTDAIRRRVRARVRPLRDDRPMGDEIEALARALAPIAALVRTGARR